MMTNHIAQRVRRAPRVAMVGLLCGLLLAPTAARAQRTWTVRGDAYAARVDQQQFGQATMSGGGITTAEVTTVDVTGSYSSGLGTAVAAGGSGFDRATSQSVATAQNVSLLGGMITAQNVVAVASVITIGNNRYAGDGDGSSVTDLVINGVAYGGGGEVAPAPNTRVDLPGVGYAILNEQIMWRRGGMGVTVNMIHVFTTSGSEIVVGSATSRIE